MPLGVYAGGKESYCRVTILILLVIISFAIMITVRLLARRQKLNA